MVPGQVGPTQMAMPSPPPAPPPVAGQTGPAQTIAPGMPPEPPGMWSQMKGMIGKTATDFVQMMGDTPEERQTNLDAFSKLIGSVNQLGSEIGQTSLPQRLGAKKGAEMVQDQQARMDTQAMVPLPPMSPERINRMMEDVGLGVQGITQATRWR